MPISGAVKSRKTRYLGSACTGSSGDLERTLTHIQTMGINSLVFVNKVTMMYDDDYAVSGKVITFHVNIDNTDVIMVYS